MRLPVDILTAVGTKPKAGLYFRPFECNAAAQHWRRMGHNGTVLLFGKALYAIASNFMEHSLVSEKFKSAILSDY